ncbi:MAG: hypothetical protein HC934_12610 [Acaryochloridaceae cyanobacterium SU_2_1]|nr:hypothetical protein [Acaryochloridaceae cyanobacterium SU_2_1]
MQTAASLFRQQGQFGNYQRAIATLKELNRQPLQLMLNLPSNLIAFLELALKTLPSLLINPGHAPFLTWQKILPYQSIGMSFIFASLVCGCVIGGSQGIADSLNLSILQLILLSSVVFCSLVLTGGLMRQMVGQGGSWSGDFLIAGATLLPLGLWAILAAPIAAYLGRLEFIALSLFAGSYAILTLYGGYTRIGQLSEPLAALAVPAALLVTYGLTMLLYKALTLQLV